MVKFFKVIAGLAFLGFSAGHASAEIHVDFGATGQRVETAPAFQGVSGAAGTAVAAAAGVPYIVASTALPDGETLSITGTLDLQYRDRGNLTTANHGGAEELLEDYIRVGTGSTTATTPFTYPTMTLNIGGLAPAKAYTVTMRVYDPGVTVTAGIYTYEITGTGDSNLANNTYSANFQNQASTPAVRAGYTEQFVSSATGTLAVTLTQTGGTELIVPLNSLDVVAVPEPGAAAIFSLAAMTFLGRRRRAQAL